MLSAIWLAIKAWGLWGRLAGLLGKAWTWALRNPAWALCAALAALCGLLWHERDVKAGQVAHLTAQANAFKTAQVEAASLAKQKHDKQEAAYIAKAQDADHAYQTQLAAAQSAADRYIAGHRLHADGTGSASATPASPQSSGAASPDRPDNPADMVAVSADDINACTVNSTRLQAARDWALGLRE